MQHAMQHRPALELPFEITEQEEDTIGPKLHCDLLAHHGVLLRVQLVHREWPTT
jgi:hypothetical protein